jgi:hypothetical protein
MIRLFLVVALAKCEAEAGEAVAVNCLGGASDATCDVRGMPNGHTLVWSG